MPDEFNARHLVRRLLALAVLVALVAVAVSSLPGLGTLRHRFAGADVALLSLIGLKLASCLSNVVAFRDVFCPRMSWRFSVQLALAEQATNVLVPTGGAGGLALGAWALGQGGMSTEYIGRRSIAFFVLTSIPNFAFVAVLGPLLLTGAVSGHVPLVLTLVLSAAAWACAVVIAALPRLLTRINPDKVSGSVVGRLRAGAVTLDKGIRDTGRLLRSGQWQAIAGAIGYLVFDIAALIAAFAAFGGGLALGPLIFAYVIGQLGGLIPLPAGVGGTDGGLIGPSSCTAARCLRPRPRFSPIGSSNSGSRRYSGQSRSCGCAGPSAGHQPRPPPAHRSPIRFRSRRHETPFRFSMLAYPLVADRNGRSLTASVPGGGGGIARTIRSSRLVAGWPDWV